MTSTRRTGGACPVIDMASRNHQQAKRQQPRGVGEKSWCAGLNPGRGSYQKGTGTSCGFAGCAGHLGRFCAFEISLGTLIRQVGPVMHGALRTAPPCLRPGDLSDFYPISICRDEVPAGSPPSCPPWTRAFGTERDPASQWRALSPGLEPVTVMPCFAVRGSVRRLRKTNDVYQLV